MDADRKEWFCGKDLCEILGFRDTKDALLTKVKKAYKKGLKSLGLAGTTPVNPVPYHAGKAVYVSEAGLYQLTFSTRLKVGERFRCWVFEDVLPSICRTGGYGRHVLPTHVYAVFLFNG